MNYFPLSGDMFGPSSATDNAVVRFDLTTGKLVQNSVVTIADTTGAIAGANSLTSQALAALVLGTGTFGTAVSVASATGIATFSAAPSAPSYTSTVATGTAPFTVASTTLVANLHAATADSSTVGSTITVVDDTTTNATMYPTWVTANTGNLPVKVTSTKLSFNPSTGTLTFPILAIGSSTIGTIQGDTFGGINMFPTGGSTVGVNMSNGGNGAALGVRATAAATSPNISAATWGSGIIAAYGEATSSIGVGIAGGGRAGFAVRVADGTLASPTIVASNARNMLDVSASAYDGSTFRTAALINITGDGTVGSGFAPGSINFYTSDAAGTSSQILRMRANGAFEFTPPQPPSVATSPGTAPGNILNFVIPTGGNSTIATTGVGGTGAQILFTGGSGGVASAAVTSSTGGTGGLIRFAMGAGGAASVAGSGTNSGGTGAEFRVNTGNGGAASTGTGVNTGGTAGALNLTSGNGGAATSGSSNTGGAGGPINLTTGNGGSGATAAGNSGTFTVDTGTAGAGGTVGSVVLKVGGTAGLTLSPTSTTLVGQAGNLTITAGTGASRTFTLQTTTSGSTATTALTAGATQVVGIPQSLSVGLLNSALTGSMIFVNKNTALPAAFSSSDSQTSFRSVGADGVQNTIECVAYNAYPVWAGGAAAGTAASPTATTTDLGVRIGMNGYTGSAWAFKGEIDIFASETWSGTANGTYIQFHTTQNTTTTRQETFRMLNNGTAAILQGGALNMTIVAGTGNSRTMAIQTTTSGGVATTALAIDATQGVTLASGATLFTDKIRDIGGSITYITGGINTALMQQQRFALLGNASSNAFLGASGSSFGVLARSITDTSSSGTVALNNNTFFGIPTYLASSATTYTDSATVYIAGVPVASTNVTQTRAHALAIGAGRLTLNPTGGTTSADGLWYGTDQAMYRASTSQVNLENTSTAQTFRVRCSSGTNVDIINNGAGNSATIQDSGFSTSGAFTIQTTVAGTRTLVLGTNSTAALTFNANQTAAFSPGARTSGVASYFTVTAPADTGQTTATESIGVNFVGATRTWVDGTVATQREHLVQAPTYNKTTTTATFTKAATFAVSAAPTAGSGVTITNPYALWVQAGTTQLDGNTVAAKPLITTPSALTYASPTSVDVTLSSCFTVTTVNATGSVTFNATAGGTAGQEMSILITNDATSAKTITFGTNFLSTGTLTASAASRHTSICFKSDGTSWYETGRAIMTS